MKRSKNKYLNAVVLSAIGIEASFATGWDVYAQIIPELEIVEDVEFGLGAGLGVRYQF